MFALLKKSAKLSAPRRETGKLCRTGYVVGICVCSGSRLVVETMRTTVFDWCRATPSRNDVPGKAFGSDEGNMEAVWVCIEL